VGAFASKDGNDPASGLAKMGWSADLSYMHDLRSGRKGHFGLAAMIRGRINAIDKKGAASTFQGQLPAYQWSVSNSSWKTAALMAGVYYTAPINEKWSFTGMLAVGAAEAWLPEINVKGIVDSTAQGGEANLVLATNKKAHATSFTAMWRAGFTYKLTGKFSLTASVDYWYLNPEFSLTQTVAIGRHLNVPGVYELANASSISVFENSTKYSQQMNSVNLSVGVAMRL